MPKDKFEGMMFPYNGHYWTFDKWADEIGNLIDCAKTYGSGTARPIGTRTKKEVLKALAKRLDEKGK